VGGRAVSVKGVLVAVGVSGVEVSVADGDGVGGMGDDVEVEVAEPVGDAVRGRGVEFDSRAWAVWVAMTARLTCCS
jgi:hypothetical protein